MKTKAVANKATVDEDEDEPKKIRSSRSKRRRTRHSSTDSESPPRKRSKKFSSRRITDRKKSKRSKVSSSSSSRRRRRSPSPSPSLSSSSSPSSVSTSSSERSVSPSPRSRARDVKKRKGRGRDRERHQKRRKTQRSMSSSSTSSSGSSLSRSKGSKRWTKDGTAKDKIGKDYENVTDDFDQDEESLVAEKGRSEIGRSEIERYEKNLSLEKIENPPSKNANETENILPSGGESPMAEEDLELILRQKALDNFRKFRAAMAGKTENGATQKETLTDSARHGVTKVAETSTASITPFRRQVSSLGTTHPTESPKSEVCGNGASPWMQKSSARISQGAAASPSRILKDSDTGGPTQQEGSTIEATRSTSQPWSPQDGRNSRSVMQRLVNPPGSASSVNQRLGSRAGVSHVNGAPRIKSVVNIPTKEGLDGSTTPQRPCENSAPAESSSEIRHSLLDINNAKGTNGDEQNTSKALAANGSILTSDNGKRQVTEGRIEDKDGSQFQKKTFSRMHDGETVEVSYKVYIPKKTPALARRKLQR